MTEKDIQLLLETLENDQIEFKSGIKATQAQEDKLHVMRAVAAFYNTKGGTILFGIQDKTATPLGVEDPQKLETGFMSQLRSCLPDLEISPQAEVVTYKGVRIVVVHCPKGARPPYKLTIVGRDRVYIRVGSTNVEANEEQIAQMYRERSSDPQDQRIIESATIKDIDIQAAKNFLKETGVSNDSVTGTETALLRAGLIRKKTDGSIAPTLAGMLLFGEKPQDYLPHAVIKADVKSDDSENDWDDIKTFNGSIFEQIEQSEAFLRRHIPTTARVVGFRRVESPLIPFEALREAIINALVHRDYQETSAEIHLRIRGSGVTIVSPGGLMPPLTIELVKKGEFAPRTRNATIADALVRKGGYMDKRGSGIERMRMATEVAGLKEPVFTDSAGSFHVLFPAPLFTKQLSPEVKMIISEDELRRLHLDTKQYKILELIEARGEVRPKEVDEYLDCSRPTSASRLEDMVKKDVLIRTTPDPRNPKVAFRLHPRFLGESAKKTGLVQEKLL